jgi:hypothetical protein
VKISSLADVTRKQTEVSIGGYESRVSQVLALEMTICGIKFIIALLMTNVLQL